MHPTICTIGPLTIYSYGLMLVLAFVASTWLMLRQAKREGIDEGTVFNFAYLVFIAGIIGSRIFFVLLNFSYYRENPLEMIMLHHGGMAWFGGLLLGSVSGVLYLKFKKLSLLKTLDLVVPFVALAQAIGRIGCLLNGCCYGKEAGFGIYSSKLNAHLIPAQLYSSLLMLGVFVVLFRLQKRRHRVGVVFFTYLLLYSLKRFGIEFLRGDSAPFLWGLTLFQVISAAVFVFALAGLIILKKKNA